MVSNELVSIVMEPFLTVFFDLLSRCHIGIIVSVKDYHYPIYREISGRTVNFQLIRMSENCF